MGVGESSLDWMGVGEWVGMGERGLECVGVVRLTRSESEWFRVD